MLGFILKKRVSFFIILIFILLFSIFFYRMLGTYLYPQVSKALVTVRISHPNISGEGFYESYGKNIASSLQAINKVARLKGLYRTNASNYEVEFDWGVTEEYAKSEVEKVMVSAKGSLPEDYKNITVNLRSQSAPFYIIVLDSKTLTDEEVVNLVENSVIPQIRSINGINEVRIQKPFYETAEIRIKQDNIIKYNISPEEIYQKVKSVFGNNLIATPFFNRGTLTGIVSISLKSSSIDELGEIIISEQGNNKILLKNLADINFKRVPYESITKYNGAKSNMIYVSPQAYADLKKFGEDLDKALDQAVELSSDLEGIKFTKVINPSEFINNAISNILYSALLGTVFAILVVLVFLGEPKAIFLVSFSIPISVILSIPLVYFKGISINLISLGGMALGVGMVVDASVVVMENIHRFRVDSPDWPLKKVIIKAVGQVRVSLIASVLTSVCVFFPLSFTAPMVNSILGELAFVLIFCLIGSLVYALFINPFLAYYFYKYVKIETPHLESFSSFLKEKIENTYKKFLTKVLYSKILIFLFLSFSTVLFFWVIVFLPSRIKKELMAKPLSNKVSFNVSYSEEFQNMDEVEAVLNEQEKIIRNISKDSLVSIYSRGFPYSMSYIISLKSTKDAEKLIAELNEQYKTEDGVNYSATNWDPSELSLPVFSDMKIVFQGSNKKKVIDYMREAQKLINKEKIYQRIFTTPALRLNTEIVLEKRINFESIKDFVTLDKISKLIRRATGRNLGSINLEDNRGKNIILSFYYEDLLRSTKNLEDLKIPYKGTSIPAKHFFNFSKKIGISELVTENGLENFSIEGRLSKNNKNIQISEGLNKVKETLEKNLKLENGYSYYFEDTQKELNTSINSLVFSLFLSIILIFLILAVQFNSIIYPLIMLISIPLGIIGVFIGLYIFNSTISLNSMLGMILLGGIAINNSILIVDFFLQIRYKEPNLTRQKQIVKAASLRITPILITMLTTLLGMIPIALALGDASNILQPFGIAVSVGIWISTFFTLFVIPILLLISIRNK